ncbi:MAG: hypothetical protein JWQ90_2280 [Hydrocarboniphaga sp.]|uniref:methyltransferase domain-containing protein n=1 Tax=Hydrocarboniphaga sp. TaxID=2033016 RepID=UPI0026027FAB|nr:class I SAM-dependent methyltransferase [Hydrocarboniphaga sp.]MDB5969830.1 hypothetical protein [Hydrocarboniphaga sp.]
MSVLQPIHKKFWQGREGALLYLNLGERFHKQFLPYHADVVSRLTATARERSITRLVESGCGRSEVLRHVIKEAAFTSATGVDLSDDLLAIARADTADERIRYEHSDAFDLAAVAGIDRWRMLD